MPNSKGRLVGTKPPATKERPCCPYCGKPETPVLEYLHAKDNQWHGYCSAYENDNLERRWTGKWRNAHRDHFCTEDCAKRWALAVRRWLLEKGGMPHEPIRPRTD